jgi:hypothetical protein
MQIVLQIFSEIIKSRKIYIVVIKILSSKD